MNAILELGEQPQVKILACDADVAKEVISNHHPCESRVHRSNMYIGLSGPLRSFDEYGKLNMPKM